MTKTKLAISCGALLAGCAAAWVACAPTEAFRQVTIRDLGPAVDVHELTPREVKRLEKVLNTETSPCGDDVTLGLAVANPARCPLAPLALATVTRWIMDDFNEAELAEAYVARYGRIKGLNINTDDAPRLGPENAPTTVVVFSDFRCPFCARAAQKLEELARQYPEELAIVFKHFPLSIHPGAELAARAGFAAHQQQRFWAMHDTLFTMSQELDKEKITTVALGLGLDLARFQDDLASAEAEQRIAADRVQGELLGVSGTPALFLNGRRLEKGLNELEERLKEEFLRQAVDRAWSSTSGTSGTIPSPSR